MFNFEEYYKVLNTPAQSLYLAQAEQIASLAAAPGDNSDKKRRFNHHKPAGFHKYIADEAFWLKQVILFEKKSAEEYYNTSSMKDLAQQQNQLYACMEKDYRNSYLNPIFMAKAYGQEIGWTLCILSALLRENLYYAKCHMRFAMAGRQALFLDAAELLSAEKVNAQELLTMIRNYEGAFSQVKQPLSLYQQYISDPTHFEAVVREADLSDKGYLYRFPVHICESDIRMSEFMDTLSDEQIDRMAASFVEGYRASFFADGKDYLRKKTVGIRHRVGMERLTRRIMELFENRMHYVPFISRITGSRLQPQYLFDHSLDMAYIFDESMMEQSLEALKAALEENAERIGAYGGPAVIEGFGEEPFSPYMNNLSLSVNEAQKKVYAEFLHQQTMLIEKYIHPDETSFTIEAWPVVQIGPDFPEIFRKMIEINTMDNDLYRKVQQSIIDAMDTADFIEIEGKDGNETRLTIALAALSNPKRQTLFYNCVADCNIPVGEVFTSPKLAGTNGVLHLDTFYYQGFTFRNLKLTFSDGMVTDYSCSNYQNEEENRKFIRDHLLFPYDTLPMGEFAIGTNTTAYRMAEEYHLLEKLPILIVEKMGPHIAIGDTCYSGAEEVPVYNPINAKEIIARENEKSALRHEHPEEAYTHVHVDLTIPYHKIGAIRARKVSGMGEDILRDGKFVLKDTEVLNACLNKPSEE